MEHIRQFDWYKFEYDPHPENFLEERDLDNSVTERILRGSFKNPFLSSDESDDEPLVVNWNKILKKQDIAKNVPLYVPGLKPVPKYLKISALTFVQHFSMLRVIVAENPSILNCYKYKLPNHNDKQNFKELEEIYKTEQKEFCKWAKTIWITGDNIKALKTAPIIEEIYQLELKIQIHNLTSLQKNYKIAGLIELRHKRQSGCSLTNQKDLVKLKISELPQVTVPSMSMKYTLYQNKSFLPKMCMKHPSKFILPNENEITELPVNKIYEKLSRYAASHNVTYIMSGEAATKLLEEDRSWTLPLFVRSQVCADGHVRNIKVIGSEIIYSKQPARYRTYNTLQYLMHQQFCKQELIKNNKNSNNDRTKNSNNDRTKKTNSTSKVSKKEPVVLLPAHQDSSSDEEDALVMDLDEMGGQSPDLQDQQPFKKEPLVHPPKNPWLEEESKPIPPEIPSPNLNLEKNLTCTCNEIFEPPKTTYKKWRLTNSHAPIIDQNVDLIIYCQHKCQMNGHEYLLESIPEYQLDLGGTVQSKSKLQSLAMSLHLRNNATLLNVRVDALTGDIVTTDYLVLSDLSPDGEVVQDAAHVLHYALSQLITLLPGDYLLVHEPRHGSNTMLYVALRLPVDTDLTLFPKSTDISDEAEMVELATPPELGPVFLPFHKFRKILPLAFSHRQCNIAKTRKKPTLPKKMPKRRPRKKKKKP